MSRVHRHNSELRWSTAVNRYRWMVWLKVSPHTARVLLVYYRSVWYRPKHTEVNISTCETARKVTVVSKAVNYRSPQYRPFKTVLARDYRHKQWKGSAAEKSIDDNANLQISNIPPYLLLFVYFFFLCFALTGQKKCMPRTPVHSNAHSLSHPHSGCFTLSVAIMLVCGGWPGLPWCFYCVVDVAINMILYFTLYYIASGESRDTLFCFLFSTRFSSLTTR